MMEPFVAAEAILEKLEKEGYKAYFVGGCVRDYLLKREITDIDIATNAKPEDLQRIFHKVIPVGIEHGTVIVRFQGHSYEITTFRTKEKKSENQFTFGCSLEDDLRYRDFTMNALAMNRKKQIIDLFQGQADMEKGLIRAVNQPSLRFREDPLRMLRACRFASHFNFNLESETSKAIKVNRSLIRSVAIERIKDEMTKLVTGPYFERGLAYLIESKLIEALPIFEGHSTYIDLLARQKLAFDSFAHMVASLYCQDETVSIQQWIKAWKGSRKEREIVQSLHAAQSYYGANGLDQWLIYQLDESLHKPFLQIIDTIYKDKICSQTLQDGINSLAIKSRDQLAVDGHTLMKWFPSRPPGKWIETMLQAIEYAIVMKELKNEQLQIKEWILCHPLATN